MREHYTLGSFDIQNAADHPIDQFNTWFDQAKQSSEKEPNAVILSTVSQDLQPDSRAVLLKEIYKGNFVFYTNYDSSKGEQLANNPKCHLLFLWLSLERQVRVKGKAIKLTPAQSLVYYKTRPRESQIGAWSSPQSEVITDRSILEQNVQINSDKYKNDDSIPIPPFWGGYAVEPYEIEFWQGRASRLHDRIRYRLDNNKWIKERLAP